jgi:ATP-binding cassette, subfamily F, member 3
MFPGKIDAFLEYQVEQRLNTTNASNATVLAKRRQLEEFIAKNKARASTATRARSKSKQLEKIGTDRDRSSTSRLRNIHACRTSSRVKVAAVRCRDLAIGYPDRAVADDIRSGNRARLSSGDRR